MRKSNNDRLRKHPVQANSQKPAGIKDIAKALGISIGTVDRALHGRSGISSKTQKRVLTKAEQLGYRPNMAARSLKLNRRLRIGVYFPRHVASFFDLLRSGAKAAASSLGLNVDLVYRTFARLDEGDVDLLTSDTGMNFDGILVTPGTPSHSGDALHGIARRGVPFVCVANDVLQKDRLACVTTDARASGAVAAELFARVIQSEGSVVAVTGNLTIPDHAEKITGFASSLSAYARHLEFLPAIESHGHPHETYLQIKRLFARKPHPRGVYISIANALPVLRALDERNLLGEVPVITTDLLPELVSFIESGKVLATLSQRPFTQGKLALEVLVRFLTDGKISKPLTVLAPHIVMRSNLALFRSYND